MCALPGFPKGVESLSPTLAAWSVACGKGGRFIEEEELCVAALGHYDTVPAFEFEEACDPAAALVGSDNFAVAVVQDAATIAHHCSARGCSEQGTGGIDAVLEGHGSSTTSSLANADTSFAPESCYETA